MSLIRNDNVQLSCVSWKRFSVSEDDANDESGASETAAAAQQQQLEIVTECWVEPQAGYASDAPHQRRFFRRLDYRALAQSVSPVRFPFFSFRDPAGRSTRSIRLRPVRDFFFESNLQPLGAPCPCG